jgi:hypothetical protein
LHSVARKWSTAYRSSELLTKTHRGALAVAAQWRHEAQCLDETRQISSPLQPNQGRCQLQGRPIVASSFVPIADSNSATVSSAQLVGCSFLGFQARLAPMACFMLIPEWLCHVSSSPVSQPALEFWKQFINSLLCTVYLCHIQLLVACSTDPCDRSRLLCFGRPLPRGPMPNCAGKRKQPTTRRPTSRRPVLANATTTQHRI